MFLRRIKCWFVSTDSSCRVDHMDDTLIYLRQQKEASQRALQEMRTRPSGDLIGDRLGSRRQRQEERRNG